MPFDVELHCGGVVRRPISERDPGTHDEGPPLDMWCGPKTRAAIDSWLLPLKEARMGDSTWQNGLTGIKYSWGNIKVSHDIDFPEGKILLCEKSTYAWNNAKGQDWERFERGPEILGAYQKSWNMAGMFGFTCNDVYHSVFCNEGAGDDWKCYCMGSVGGTYSVRSPSLCRCKAQCW